MLLRYFATVLILTGTHSALAQGWQHYFGSGGVDAAYDVAETLDGGFVAAGYTSGYGGPGKNVYVVKTNAAGKLEWQQVIGEQGDQEASAIVQNAIGEYFIAGQTSSGGAGGLDVFVVKLNASGGLVWMNSYGGAQNDFAKSMLMTPAGDIVIGGTTSSSGAGGSDAYLLKINDTGQLVWSKTFGKTGNEAALSLSPVHDGGFLLCGTTTSFASNYGYAIRTNASGDSLWTRSFNIGTLSGAALYSCSELISNNQFVFAGYGGYFSYGNLVTIITDLAGSPVSTNYSTLLSDGGYGICPTSDGGFATVSYYCNFGCRAVLTKFNATGAKLWQQYYLYGDGLSYVTFSSGRSLQQTADGGYIMAGYTFVPGQVSDLLLIKTDANGITPNDHIATPVASGPTQFCQGGSVQLTVPSGYDRYQWLKFSSNNCTWLTSSDTNSITVTASGGYQCIMTYSGEIYFSSLSQVNVITAPAATISASGPLSFCGPVQNLTLTAPSAANTVYEWQLNGNPIAGATSNSYSPSVAGSYTVTMTNLCGSSTSAPAVINNSLSPSANINSTWATIDYINWQLCYYPYFSVPSQQGVTYQWYFNGSLVSGQTTNSIPAYQPGDYYVTVINGCDTTTSAIASAFPNNYSSSVYSSDDVTGCGSFPVTLQTDYSVTGYYQWYLNNNPISGANADTYLATTNGSYSCEIVLYCQGSYMNFFTNPLQVSLNGTPNPSISAAGNTTVCSGTVTLSASQAGATYQWYKDNAVISGATSQNYAASVTGNYKCQINSATCGNIMSNTLFVKVGLPTLTITSGNTVICDGSVIVLSMSTTDNSNSFTAIQWRLNGSAIPGAVNSTYSATMAGNYDCLVSNACGTTTTNTISLTSLSLNASVSPTGPVVICPGQSQLLTAATGAGYTYQWYLNNGVIGGATASTYNATVAGTYKIRITGSGCQKFSNNVQVVQSTVPSISIWASTQPVFCVSGSVVLNSATRSDFTYNWTRNGMVLPGATGSSYTAIQGGNYRVTVTDSAGCTGASNDFYVNSTGLMDVSITASGPVIYCHNGTVTLSSATTGSSYQWSNGSNPIPGAINQNYIADSSGVYFLQVTNQQGCTGTASLSVSEYPLFTMTPAVTHPSCNQANGSIGVSLTGYNAPVFYQWSTGASTSSVTNLPAGTYTLTVTEGKGCVIEETFILTQTGPPAIVTAASPTSVCAGSAVVLNANTGSGLTYQWKKFGNNIPGATGATYNATSSGKYKVIVTDVNGCSSASNAVTVTIYPLPAAAITATGNTTFCAGGSVQLSANTGTGLTYQWRKYNNDIAGATGSTYLATKAGKYSVRVTNTNGCSKVSNKITITILPAPVASISANGPTTFCSGDSVLLTANTGAGLSYQWKLGGNPVAGATQVNYTAKIAGNYKCTVTNSSGCTRNSNVIAVSVPCREAGPEMPVQNYDFTVFPNPSTGAFTIRLTDVPPGKTEIYLMDITGRIRSSYMLEPGELSMDAGNVSPGLYIVELRQNGMPAIRKPIIVL